MSEFEHDPLIELLLADRPTVRTNALELLSDSYADDPRITEFVFRQWDRLGVAEAFPEFPLLPYFPVDATRIDECCQRSAKMVAGRKLTDPETRCAGKLIEHLTMLPADALEPHFELLEKTTQQSKIFFRVDLPGIHQRIEFASLTADQLAEQLDEAITRLSANPEDEHATKQALNAIGTLRRQHPDYLDLQSVIGQVPSDQGPQAISFQLTLQSLIEFSHPGLEPELAQHLADERESVHSIASTALVRTRTRLAAHSLIEQYQQTPPENQKWIARGLQRIRVPGSFLEIADCLGQLRGRTTDPALRLMLLVAELRQLDPSSCSRIAEELDRVSEHSEFLLASLMLYADANQQAPEIDQVWQAYRRYKERIQASLASAAEGQPTAGMTQQQQSKRAKLRQQLLAKYRRRRPE
jgi:hypothetical protein